MVHASDREVVLVEDSDRRNVRLSAARLGDELLVEVGWLFSLGWAMAGEWEAGMVSVACETAWRCENAGVVRPIIRLCEFGPTCSMEPIIGVVDSEA